MSCADQLLNIVSSFCPSPWLNHHLQLHSSNMKLSDAMQRQQIQSRFVNFGQLHRMMITNAAVLGLSGQQ